MRRESCLWSCRYQKKATRCSETAEARLGVEHPLCKSACRSRVCATASLTEKCLFFKQMLTPKKQQENALRLHAKRLTVQQSLLGPCAAPATVVACAGTSNYRSAEFSCQQQFSLVGPRECSLSKRTDISRSFRQHGKTNLSRYALKAGKSGLLLHVLWFASVRLLRFASIYCFVAGEQDMPSGNGARTKEFEAYSTSKAPASSSRSSIPGGGV